VWVLGWMCFVGGRASAETVAAASDFSDVRMLLGATSCLFNNCEALDRLRESHLASAHSTLLADTCPPFHPFLSSFLVFAFAFVFAFATCPL
jgi:hypothetical protein